MILHRGWTSFACAVSTCPQFTTCSACSQVPDCGWCDSQQKCMTGTGFGPSDKDTSCPEWFFYSCVTVKDTLVDGNTIISFNPFSDRIHVIDCDESCIDSSVANRGNSLTTPGSQMSCDRRKRACRRFSSCYKERPDLACAITNNLNCRVHSEIQCPNGQPPFDRLIVSPTNQSNMITGGGKDVFGKLVICKMKY